jgi:hypothetical protein
MSSKTGCKTALEAQRPSEPQAMFLSSHSRVYRIPRRNPLPSRILIANDNRARIVILPVLRNEGSDRRASKNPSSRSPRRYRRPRILIANADASSIAILSDRRESKDRSSSIPHHEQLSTILIANPELEFHLTGCRTNHIKFSNRKFMTIFRSIPRSALLTACSSTHVVLIYGGAIRIRRNTLKR